MNHKRVHAVRTAADNAAQTARSEFQTLIKALFQFFYIIVFYKLFDFAAKNLVCFLRDVLFCPRDNFVGIQKKPPDYMLRKPSAIKNCALKYVSITTKRD